MIYKLEIFILCFFFFFEWGSKPVAQRGIRPAFARQDVRRYGPWATMESAVAARGEVTSYGPPARLRVSEHPPHSCVRPMRGARRRLAGSSTVHTGDKGEGSPLAKNIRLLKKCLYVEGNMPLHFIFQAFSCVSTCVDYISPDAFRFSVYSEQRERF